jgi:hypothetical protein
MSKYKLFIALVGAVGLALGGFSIVQTSKANPPCSGPSVERVTTGNQDSSVSAPTGFIAAGATACQVPVDDAPDGVFLCYSKFQVVPNVWPQDQAAMLLAAGYWYPNAVPGNDPMFPNLGKYHLVCNAPGTSTGMVVNENGEVFPEAYAHQPGAIGYYPLAG